MPIIPEWITDEARYRLERLNLKEKINSVDPKVHFTVAGVCVLIFLVTIISFLWPNKQQAAVEYKKAWFYDLNTGKLFVEKKTETPPIDAPSGSLPDGSKAGVGAYVYSYLPNPAESDRIIGFLWKTDPQADIYDSADRWDTGKLVKSPNDQEWVKAGSKKGKKIISGAFKKNENGIEPIDCLPD